MKTKHDLDNKAVTIGLSICDNKTICKINRRFLKRNASTDVISFTINENLPKGNYFLGDIIVSLDQIKKQAKVYHVSEAEELARVVAHGVLHLLGYEDEKEQERKEMKQAEDKILRRIFKE